MNKQNNSSQVEQFSTLNRGWMIKFQELLALHLTPYQMAASMEVVASWVQHFQGVAIRDLHEAFLSYERGNAEGRMPTPGRILQVLQAQNAQKKSAYKSLDEVNRAQKKEELNAHCQHVPSEQFLQEVLENFGLVPAWRVNSNGSVGWNWGGVENCIKIGNTMIDGIRTALYVRKSHYGDFMRKHQEQKREGDELFPEAQDSGLEHYCIVTKEKGVKGEEKEIKRHYVRANTAARIALIERYQQKKV